MPTELVLLSEIEPSDEALRRAAFATWGERGRLLKYSDIACRQVVDPGGKRRLTVFRSKAIEHKAEAHASLVDPPLAFGLWTDLNVPYGDPTVGRALAEALAEEVAGIVRERA